MADRFTIPFKMTGAAQRDPSIAAADTAASFIEPRVKFVRGWKSIANGGDGDPGDGTLECGAGTLFPMLVTPYELTDIFYRVRNSRFNAGRAITGTMFGVATPIAFSVSDPDEENDNTATELDYPCVRAYWVEGANATGEIQIWNYPAQAFPAYGGHDGQVYGSPNQCGFRHYMEDNVGTFEPIPEKYHVYIDNEWFGFISNSVRVEFSGRVAFVDNAGTGNPFSATNELWIGMAVSARWALDILNFAVTSFDNDVIQNPDPDFTYPAITPVFSMVLSNSNVSCPLYGESFLGNQVYSGNDLVIRATEWLPYAHQGPLPSPFFNRFTGEYIPPFPTGALLFDDPNNSNIIPAI